MGAPGATADPGEALGTPESGVVAFVFIVFASSIQRLYSSQFAHYSFGKYYHFHTAACSGNPISLPSLLSSHPQDLHLVRSQPPQLVRQHHGCHCIGGAVYCARIVGVSHPGSSAQPLLTSYTSQPGHLAHNLLRRPDLHHAPHTVLGRLLSGHPVDNASSFNPQVRAAPLPSPLPSCRPQGPPSPLMR